MSEETIVTTPWWERYSTDLVSRETHRIEVFFRSLAPSQGAHNARTGILQRLSEADDRNLIDGYDVNVVGEGVCLCEDCAETRIARHMYETLSTLRSGGEPDVEPVGFRERSVDSAMTGEAYSVLVPPEVTFAVYVDGTLRGVFPSTVDGHTVTVSEYLDALSTLDSRRPTARAQA